MIEVSKFYKMKNDSMSQYGFKKGDPVYIGGSGFVPDSKTDPYKFRLVFVGVSVVDNHILVGERGFTVDGKNLRKCTKGELEILEKNKDEDFRAEDTTEAEVGLQEETV